MIKLFTANNVQGAVGQHGVNVHIGPFGAFGAFFGEQVAHDAALLIENIYKIV